jgi:hypothetical protein
MGENRGFLQKCWSKNTGKVTGLMPNDKVSSLQYYVTDISAAHTCLENAIPILRTKSPTVTAITFLLWKPFWLGGKVKKVKLSP